MEKMFEIATRSKMRFPFKGLISVEDLWDLNVESLDSVFKILNSQVKQANEESLLEVKTKQDTELEIKIEIIKYIVKLKVQEEALKLAAKEAKELEQKILEILSEKQDERLKNKTVDELKAMLNELS